MTVICYIKNDALVQSPEVIRLVDTLRARGVDVVMAGDRPCGEADMLLSIGGDGTFLSTATLAVPSGIPVLGVNLGRLGFLSENTVESVCEHLPEGSYSVEERSLLEVCRKDGAPVTDFPYAVNEISLFRHAPGTIGVDVSIDGMQLPTYWADGILVSTESGSTAYNLSIGGPICVPGANVLLVSPIAPHNLGVRPLVVNDASRIDLSLRCRGAQAELTLDNRSVTVSDGMAFSVRKSPETLRRVVLGKSSFIDALGSRFFWGKDVRNLK